MTATGLPPERGTIETSLGWIILSSIFIYCLLPVTAQFLPALIGLGGLAALKWKSAPLKLSFEKKDWFLFLAIPALGILSSLWSITPEASLMRGIKISAEILLTLSFPVLLTNLPETTINLIRKHFHIPLIAAGTLLAIELNTGLPALHLIYPDTPVFGWTLNKNVSIFSLLLPFAALLCVQAKAYKELTILALPTLAILFATDSQATQLAVIVMGIAAGVGYISPRTLLVGACTGFAILACAFPWIAPPIYQHLAGPDQTQSEVMTKTSFYARLEIWDFISASIKQKPLTGYGMDTTRAMTFDHKIVYHPTNTVLHPHNAILQIWNDFGLIGIATLFLMIGTAMRSLFKSENHLIATSMIVFSGLSIYLLASWSVWASWLIGLMILLYAFVPLTSPSPKNKESQPVSP